MTDRPYSGLFVSEGTSDLPLADLVESLFVGAGASVRLSKPDYSLLPKVSKDVRSRVQAGLKLVGGTVDLIVVHRDADNAGHHARQQEIRTAVQPIGGTAALVPVIPVRMTEAWLLLDETAIRQVAGNPRGRVDLGLPKHHQVESIADPKELLRTCLVRASEAGGRRREAVGKRFNQHRRQLLERLDPQGPVVRLDSWARLVDDVDRTIKTWDSTVR
ncbi:MULTISPECIES: DUF4276 family protein [Micromonospora]|uniref:DUF4276 domain-containing protein n=1 Tax=Micromonospora yangpuensis TaxID=683228 RepID=A0A1C6V117_9ACTN|nr:DUF4276 family protein [Micromonospora yangpuensis]GGL97360.1 hypothetical protein GCM10012279_13580 [Micromonospora yangpuensis]SCL59986.1 protein of unknown function [Micromonospora yangpuensis]